MAFSAYKFTNADDFFVLFDHTCKTGNVSTPCTSR